ncbi:5-methyltetrahydropteroyltriglutamate--homocysteine methyltransferase [Bienertia sinuspersici]
MGEAMAVRSGLKTAIEAGFRQLIVEVDNLALFFALSKKKMDLTAYGLLLKDIFLFLFSMSLGVFCFNFVRRSGNLAAHILAKKSLSVDGFRVWLEEIPVEIQQFVLDGFINE